jgi:hypothetical protein
MKTSAHTQIGLKNEDTCKLRKEVTLFSTGIMVLALLDPQNDILDDVENQGPKH